MNLFEKFGRKFRYGMTSVGIAAAVLAFVLLFNVGFGVLSSNGLWQTDMTPKQLYTLTSAAKTLLKEAFDSTNEKRDEDEPVQVDIIFCNDADQLMAQEASRYVYRTALSLQKAFPKTIHVKTVNVWQNPSAVDAYRTNSFSSIYQSQVIVASGTEFRVYSLNNFYTYDTTDSTTPWAYSGEKKFVQGILAVTRAESPVCALTTNHGEPVAEDTYSAFRQVIEDSGYEVVYLNLETDEIPENCRLIITLGPQTDFLTTFHTDNTVDETKKLDAFLANANSYMVLADASTPKLPVLESYLEQWGIAFGRFDEDTYTGITDEGNLQITDSVYSVDAAKMILQAQYEDEGLGGSVTEDMRNVGGSPKVVFGNSMPIYYSSTYKTAYALADEDEGTGAYVYGSYFSNSWSRKIYDVFRTSDSAYAYGLKADGTRLTDLSDNPLAVDTSAPYRLMTLTSERKTVSEGQGYTTIDKSSYVCAVGSLQFASNDVLMKNEYGNTDVLLSVFRAIGREIDPVGLTWKTLNTAEIGTDYLTESQSVGTTVALCILPAVLALTFGTVILIRRKARR